MHIMLDLETLSTHNDAFIISIGAVKFNNTGIVEGFFETVELTDSTKLHISPVTVGWWLGQHKEAQKMLQQTPLPLREVLTLFEHFVLTKDTNRAFTKERLDGMWGNSSTFDNMILRNAYMSENMKVPWHFRYDRCYRTLKYILPEQEFERIGVHHSPLYDAKSQALHMIKICQTAGIDLGDK